MKQAGPLWRSVLKMLRDVGLLRDAHHPGLPAQCTSIGKDEEMKNIKAATIAALSVAGLSIPASASEFQHIRHQVQVPHGEREVTAVYQPKTMVSYRQIGNM